MKRTLVLVLTGLALVGGHADAARRSSGGGFGGSRSSGSSSRPPSYRAPSYRAPTYRSPSTPTYRVPSTPRPPANSAGRSPYTAPGTAPSTRTPSTTQRTTLPSNATVAQSAANKAAAARVTSTQLGGWKNVKLPAGVPRRAITYSATPSSQYQYQLQPGRYYPYPQSYYRQHGIGYDILKYALIFTAVSSVADALDGPDVVVNNVNNGNFGNELDGVTSNNPVTPAPAGPNLWTYVGVGFLAAAAGWFLLGRRR
ncbi:hypothetical protein WDJ50_14210 [Deinococcus sp. VB142]|uniref:Uncharacterized protein n=1 Tax=Deinococcus sp. VB142 TaxID=3112952 RepID=A0AAU6Q2D1_9DEIO